MPKKLSDTQMRVVYHANDMLWFWKDLTDRCPEGKGAGSFYELRARQAYHDSLLSMKRVGLIESYDVVNTRVMVDGEWYSDRYQLKFRPHKQGRSK